MCGICGVLHFDEQTPSPGVLSRMTDILRHRGPDARGVHIDGPVGLGHRRLAVIDLSPAGVQPMTNEDGSLWIVFNGEIYNFAEVRRRLENQGHVFRSETDTEVILHAYETWGIDCLAQLNGMFAFALWDSSRKQLWLVRDRLGIKPLFYLQRDDRLLFASEIKSILCDQTVTRQIDYTSLHHYLSLNYTPAPHTLFQGICQLTPGQYLLVNADGRSQAVTYWQPSYRAKRAGSENELIETFESQMKLAVKRRLVSDVPLGAFLSGGVDSTAIVYWMSRQIRQPVQTFSIGFREDSYSELGYARQVASCFHTDHHERVVTPDTVDILPRIVWHAEEPTADSSMVPLYYLAQMAREKVTVALAGDGADEILAGYETYQAFYIARLYRTLPKAVRRHVIRPLVEALPVSYGKVSWDYKLKRFVRGAELDAEAAHGYWRMIFDDVEKRDLYTAKTQQFLGGTSTIDLFREVFAETDADHPLDRLLYVDSRFYLPNDMLVKVDRMTMAHGLEARVPFLDHQVVELAAALPAYLKLKGYRHKKYALKRAMQQRVPQLPIWRKKAGFNVPKAQWLTGELRDFAFDHLGPGQIGRMGLFKPDKVNDLLNDHMARKQDHSHRIWGLLCLSLWWQQFMTNDAKVDRRARDRRPTGAHSGV
jgi:asparagine synthase (glutamine-hydrolysing)